MSAVVERATVTTEPEGQESAMQYATKSQWQVERFIAKQVCWTQAVAAVPQDRLLNAILEFVNPEDLAAAQAKEAGWRWAARHAPSAELREWYYHVCDVMATETQRVRAEWEKRFTALLVRLVQRQCLAQSRHKDPLGNKYWAYEPGPDYRPWNYHRDDPEPATGPQENQDGSAAA